MLYVINYADGYPFEDFRKVNTRTAYKYGKADKVLEYSPNDIPTDYKLAHKSIFANKRGAGLWLWKPYIILDALRKAKEGDYLFYCDSGSTVINDIHYLVDCSRRNNADVMTFEIPLLCRQFTKRECYAIMELTDNSENQSLGILLIKKSSKSMAIVAEWLRLCENEELLSPKRYHPEIEEWKDFYAHREDQSLLSMLRMKYNLESFRDCSDYGEMPFMYAQKMWTYNPKEYKNSDYPTIILCNRLVSPFMYWLLYKIKSRLNKLGIFYTEKRILRRRGIV